MSKFADIFGESGVPYPMTVKAVDRNVTTKFGSSTVVLLDYEGEEYKWFVDDEKFSRTFPKDVFPGDEISVTKKAHPKNASWSYYTTEITKRSEDAVTPAQQKAVKAEAVKDKDVTQYRMGLAGVTQSLLSSGMAFDDALKAKAIEVTKWIREEAERMYDEDHVVEDAKEVFPDEPTI